MKRNSNISVPCFWDGSQVSQTLTARNAGGAQRMPDKQHFQCVIDVVDETPTYKEVFSMSIGYYMDIGHDVSPTLLARDYKDPLVICYEKGE